MKAQKFTSILLAILLLATNVSLAINVHFCEGKIASVSSVFNVKEICDEKIETKKACCKKSINTKKHEDCCKDKVFDLQENASDVIVKTFSFQIDVPFIYNEWTFRPFNTVEVVEENQKLTYYCDANAPPLFKLYRQLIFYA